MKKRTRRAKKKQKKTQKQTLRFLGVNAAGLKCKLLSFKNDIEDLKPSVFMVEETKHKESGKFKLENFVIYELVRNESSGGGLALGVAEELQPAWVREGEDGVEALSVILTLKNIEIRCCVAYGFQENEKNEKKENFWRYLDEDVIQSDMAGTGFILQFDGNLWAGNKIIPEDPRPQNRNGRMFQEFLERHPHLTVINSLEICDGLITRSRVCDGALQESVLDFFVVCSRVLPFVTRMVIDTDRKYILTNYKPSKRGGDAVDTDHYTQYMDVNLEISHEKNERIEIFNFKDGEGQINFKNLTTKTDEFTKCFMNEKPFKEQMKEWEQLLNKFCSKSFKKIRIRKKNEKPINKSIKRLIVERNILTRKNPENEKRLKEICSEISSLEAEEIYHKIVKQFTRLSDDPEQINVQQMWKLSNKLWPKNKSSVPAAKKKQTR